MNAKAKILYSVTYGLLGYFLLELSYSALYVNGVIAPPPAFWVFEDSGKTVHFDPISGFRYSRTASRVARINPGRGVEYVASFRGNNQGFADRDDFTPAGGPAQHPRIAVLGDSFTAAEHLGVNWPDRVERQMDVALLNFSVAGGGLANWWSIVTRLLDAQNYRIDGLLFAVFEGDLQRTFTFSDHRDSRYHQFARTPSWQPGEWPASLAEARALMQPLRGFIVSPERFEQALRGAWHPELPRPWRPYAALQLLRWLEPARADDADSGFVPGQLALIDGIAAYAARRSLPIMVVTVPSREALLANRPAPEDARAFAARLGARFVDGAQAFAGLDERSIRELWLPVDGHWAQGGSDRFAAFMQTVLVRWLAEHDIGIGKNYNSGPVLQVR